MKRGLTHLLIMSLAIAFVPAHLNPVSLRADQMGPPSDNKDGNRKKSKTKEKQKRKKQKRKHDRSGKNFPKGKGERRLRKQLGDEYEVRRTDHFSVIYNADKKVLTDSMFRLEKTYDAVHSFALELKIRIKYPREKLLVVFCRDFDEYNLRCEQLTGKKAPPDAAGLYFSMPLNVCIFYDVAQSRDIKEAVARANKLEQDSKNTTKGQQRRALKNEAKWIRKEIRRLQEQLNRSVIQHEVAHQLLFNLGVHTSKRTRQGRLNPIWFAEGLATHFEPAQTGSGVKRPNRYRLRAMCDVLDRGIPSMRKFIVDPTGGAEGLTAEGYAWSWLLTHFLIRRHGEKLPGYVERIKARDEGENITPERDMDDFESCFGRIDETREKEWKEFVNGYIRRVCK